MNQKNEADSSNSDVDDDLQEEFMNTKLDKNFIDKYIFMMWDGIGFFAMNTTKLKRLRGTKPKWTDNYSGWKNIV